MTVKTHLRLVQFIQVNSLLSILISLATVFYFHQSTDVMYAYSPSQQLPPPEHEAECHFADESVLIDLNEASLCEVGFGFLNRDIGVFVFVSDAQPQSKVDWYSIRARIESEWGIYNPINDSYEMYAFEVAITTSVVSGDWGYDVAFGESLDGTPLDDDDTILRLEAQLKNAVVNGDDLNRAIADVIRQSYHIAFPVSEQLIQPTQIVPTMVPATQVAEPITQTQSEVPASATTVENTDSDGGGFAVPSGLMWGIAGLIGLFVLFTAVWAIVGTRLRRMNQIGKIRGILDQLLSSLDEMLYTDGSKESSIIQIWQSQGGANNTKQHKEFVKLAEEASAKVAKALQIFNDLKSLPATVDLVQLNERLNQWENLYMTVVGTSKDVLAMTQEEIGLTLDAFGIAKSNNSLGNSAGPLRIYLETVNVQENQEGILSNVVALKSIILDLEEAQDKAPVALAEAQRLLEATRTEVQLPSGLTAEVYDFVTDQIEANQQMIDEGALLDALTAAQKLPETISALRDTIAKFAEQTVRADEIDAQIKAFLKEAYNLNPVDEKLDQAEKSQMDALKAISDGRYAEAVSELNAMVADLESALAEMQRLSTLRNETNQRLAALSEQVAKAQADLTGEVFSDWKKLQQYPSSNYSEGAGNYGIVSDILVKLFDEPSNPKDLTSDIAELNTMQVQSFDLADQKLDEAYADLARALELMAGIQRQYQLVVKLEQDLAGSIENVQQQLLQLTAVRDAQNNLIDAPVDVAIEKSRKLLTQADGYQGEKEFIAGQSLVTEAQQLIVSSLASANEQIALIEKAMAKHQEVKQRATAEISEAEAQLNEIPESVRSAVRYEILKGLRNAFAEAERTESAITSKQDRELAKVLSTTVNAYETIAADAEALQSSINSDRREYESQIAAAAGAIEQARTDINNARKAVQDSDANDAGDTSLNRAEAMSLNAPTFGMSLQEIQALIRLAAEAKTWADKAKKEAEAEISRVKRNRKAEEDRIRERNRINTMNSLTSTNRSNFGGGSFGGGSSGGGSRRSTMGSSRRR